jgi:hypothetical protein
MPMIVRDKNGTLKFRLDDLCVMTTIQETPGKWVPYKVEGKPEVSAYELLADTVYTVKLYHRGGTQLIELFLWVGDKLIPSSY